MKPQVPSTFIYTRLFTINPQHNKVPFSLLSVITVWSCSSFVRISEKRATTLAMFTRNGYTWSC